MGVGITVKTIAQSWRGWLGSREVVDNRLNYHQNAISIILLHQNAIVHPHTNGITVLLSV